MDTITAVKAAAEYLEKRGFVAVGKSGEGDAIYLARPGRSNRLRVASYGHDHGDTNMIISYREAWERDEKRVGWIASDADLHAACDDVTAEYDAVEIDED